MNNIFGLLIAALLVLPACGPQYKKPQLKDVASVDTYQTQNGISVNAQHLTRAQIHQTFGIRGRKLGYYGLCPIALSIKNESADSIIFDPANVSIAYADHAQVAACLQNRTVFTTASLLGLGLLATGAVYLCTLPFVIWYQITGMGTLMYLGLGAATGMLVLTPTACVYYAKKAHAQNKIIETDMHDIAACHTRTITSGQELDVILFAKKENCSKDFSVSLINEATQEPTLFNITH